MNPFKKFLAKRAFSATALDSSPFGSTALPAGAHLAGLSLAAVSIAFAPPDEFDDLDVMSYCQRYSAAGGDLNQMK